MPVTVTELARQKGTLEKIRDHALNGIERIDAWIAKIKAEEKKAK